MGCDYLTKKSPTRGDFGMGTLYIEGLEPSSGQSRQGKGAKKYPVHRQVGGRGQRSWQPVPVREAPRPLKRHRSVLRETVKRYPATGGAFATAGRGRSASVRGANLKSGQRPTSSWRPSSWQPSPWQLSCGTPWDISVAGDLAPRTCISHASSMRRYWNSTLLVVGTALTELCDSRYSTRASYIFSRFENRASHCAQRSPAPWHTLFNEAPVSWIPKCSKCC